MTDQIGDGSSVAAVAISSADAAASISLSTRMALRSSRWSQTTVEISPLSRSVRRVDLFRHFAWFNLRVLDMPVHTRHHRVLGVLRNWPWGKAFATWFTGRSFTGVPARSMFLRSHRLVLHCRSTVSGDWTRDHCNGVEAPGVRTSPSANRQLCSSESTGIPNGLQWLPVPEHVRS